MNTDVTIDPREVNFYTQLAETWWDGQGPFWPLHRLNELRVPYILDKLCQHFGLAAEKPQPLAGLRLLDVGCGGGILSESMAQLGAQVTGIDVVEKNIRIATLHAEKKGLNIDYRVCPATDLVAAGKQFDVVLNMEVVEHVADLEAFMRQCCKLTANDGVMFVSTINRTPRAWLFAIVGAEYILRWLPKGTHRWRLFRKPHEIRALLDSGGLRIADITGVAANPLTKTLRLVDSTSVNYMLFATRSDA